MISLFLNIVAILASKNTHSNQNLSEMLVDNPSALDQKINISAKSWLFGNMVDSMVNNTNFRSLKQQSYAAEKSKKEKKANKSKAAEESKKKNNLMKDSDEDSNI
ncbi:hypothetical protein GINT2_001139 [Glugoides intestinalis]